jgi:methylglutaconyl-CoA hydratase
MSLVTSETVDGVCTITLDDAENRNALSVALLADFMTACDQAEADDAVRVIVVTNNGSTFSAGASLRQQTGGQTAAPDRVVELTDVYGRFARSPKPYVGRIAGHAVAGGLGLAAALDISIAIDNAKMGFTEVRIGVAPAMISVVCLPKMRPAEARAAMLRGNRFRATEAARLGLINAAVPADELDAAVAEVVGDLLAGGPNALAATKRLLATVPTLSPEEAYAWTGPLSAELFASDEGQEGMQAYLEKRRASWVPRRRSEEP